MKYEFKELSKKQIILDKYIISNNIDMDDETYWKFRSIALSVEISEIANEIRFFKFWSNKPASHKEIILEEWIDCLHFILSLANTLGGTSFEKEITLVTKNQEDLYIEIQEKNTILFKRKEIINIESILFLMCEMAFLLDFSMKDINESYKHKNKINFQRQKNNY